MKDNNSEETIKIGKQKMLESIGEIIRAAKNFGKGLEVVKDKSSLLVLASIHEKEHTLATIGFMGDEQELSETIFRAMVEQLPLARATTFAVHKYFQHIEESGEENEDESLSSYFQNTFDKNKKEKGN